MDVTKIANIALPFIGKLITAFMDNMDKDIVPPKSENPHQIVIDNSIRCIGKSLTDYHVEEPVVVDTNGEKSLYEQAKEIRYTHNF
jgi:hypothetical protein